MRAVDLSDPNNIRDAGTLTEIGEMDISRSQIPIEGPDGRARFISYAELLEELSEDAILSGNTAPTAGMADVNASQIYIWNNDTGILTYYSASGTSVWSLLKGFNLTVGGNVPDDATAFTGLIQLHLKTSSDRSIYYSTADQDTWTAFDVGHRNVQSDWNATEGDAEILNKPTIPDAQEPSDWNATEGVSRILNKPTIPTAASFLKEISESIVLSGSAAPTADMADANAAQIYIWNNDTGILTYFSASGASTWSLLKGFNLTVSGATPADTTAFTGLIQLHLKTGGDRSIYYSTADQNTWTEFDVGSDFVVSDVTDGTLTRADKLVAEDVSETGNPNIAGTIGEALALIEPGDTRSDVETAKTAAYTVLATDEGNVLPIDTSSGNIAVTLPNLTSSQAGWSVYIQKTVAANTATINGHGTDTINGNNELVLTKQYHLVELMWTGSAWFIVSDASAPIPVTDISGKADRDLQNIATLTDDQKKRVRDGIDALSEDDFTDHEEDFYTSVSGLSIAVFGGNQEPEVLFTNADGSTVVSYNPNTGDQTSFWNAINTANAGRIYIKDDQGSYLNDYGLPSSNNPRNPVFADNDVLVFYPSGGSGRVEITLSSGPTAHTSETFDSKWYAFDNVNIVGSPTNYYAAYRVTGLEHARIQINRHDIVPALPNLPNAPRNESAAKKYDLQIPANSGDPTWVESTAGTPNDGSVTLPKLAAPVADRLLTHIEEVKLRALDLEEENPEFTFPVTNQDSPVATINETQHIRNAEGQIEFTPDHMLLFRSLREIAITGAANQMTLTALREVQTIQFYIGSTNYNGTIKAGSPEVSNGRSRIDAVLASAADVAAIAPTSGSPVRVGMRFLDADGENLYQSGIKIDLNELDIEGTPTDTQILDYNAGTQKLRWVNKPASGGGGGSSVQHVATLPTTHTAGQRFRLTAQQTNAKWYIRKFTRVATNDNLNFAANNVSITTGNTVFYIAADNADETAALSLGAGDEFILHPATGNDTVIALSGAPTTPSPLNSVEVVSVAAADHSVSGEAITNGTSYTVYLMRVGTGEPGDEFESDGEQLFQVFDTTPIENTPLNVDTPANENLHIPTRRTVANAINLNEVVPVATLPANVPNGRKVKLTADVNSVRTYTVAPLTGKVGEDHLIDFAATSVGIFAGVLYITMTAAEAATYTALGANNLIILVNDTEDVIITLSGSPTTTTVAGVPTLQVAATDYSVTSGTITDTRSYNVFAVTVANQQKGTELEALDGVWRVTFDADAIPTPATQGQYNAGSDTLMPTVNQVKNHIAAAESTFNYWGGAINPLGEIDEVDIEIAGTGYTNGTAIGITGGGANASGASLAIIASDGHITSVSVTNAGTGYGEDTTATAPTGTGAVLTPVIDGSGRITSITVENGGSGYTNNASITFGDTGGGTGAAATITTANGVITGITYTNRGQEFTEVPTLSVTGGTGARLTATITPSAQNRATRVNAPNANAFQRANRRWVLIDGSETNKANHLRFRNPLVNWQKASIIADLEIIKGGANNSGGTALGWGYNDGETPTWGGGGENGIFLYILRLNGGTHDGKLVMYVGINDEEFADSLGNQVLSDFVRHLRTDTNTPYRYFSDAARALQSDWGAAFSGNGGFLINETANRFRLHLAMAGSQLSISVNGTLQVIADLARPFPAVWGPRYYFFGDGNAPTVRRSYLYSAAVGAPPPANLFGGF